MCVRTIRPTYTKRRFKFRCSFLAYITLKENKTQNAMTILSDIVTGWGVGQALTVLYQLLSRYFDRRVLQRRKWKNSWDISDSVADFWVPLENKRILPGDLVQVHRTALCEIVPLTYWGETRNRYLVNLMEENKARGVDFAHPDRDAFSGRMYNMTLLTLYAGVRLLPRNGIRLIAACYEEGFGDQDGYLFTTANAIPLILPESVYNSILSKRLRAQGSAVCELRRKSSTCPSSFWVGHKINFQGRYGILSQGKP